VNGFKKKAPQRTAMTTTNENKARTEVQSAWSVVVIYENPPSRERAVDFCDRLVKRFWARCEFEVSWWPFEQLQDPPVAAQTADRAAKADLVVVASTEPGDFPIAIQSWFERWLQRRNDREGMLAGLLEPSAEDSVGRRHKDNYLRQVAHRAEMDYLTQLPAGMSLSIPESLESYTERAACVTSVLDEILHHHTPPRLVS
jgi:hypothetical protein